LSILTAVIVSDAYAGKRGGGGGRNGQNSQNQQNAQNNAATAKQKAAVDAARTQVTDAQAELTKANKALDDLVGPLRAKFESSPDMVAALAALKDAQADHDKAAATVAAALANDSNYQAALAKKDVAQDKLDKLRNDGGSQDQITAAAAEVMDVGSTAAQIRFATENGDNNLVQARAKLTAADAKISELNHQFQESLKSDPQWTEAKKAIDDANTKLIAANKSLEAAMAGKA
jgi:chromosome segregation ATPase